MESLKKYDAQLAAAQETEIQAREEINYLQQLQTKIASRFAMAIVVHLVEPQVEFLRNHRKAFGILQLKTVRFNEAQFEIMIHFDKPCFFCDQYNKWQTMARRETSTSIFPKFDRFVLHDSWCDHAEWKAFVAPSEYDVPELSIAPEE
jgi:hypothetical protein